MRNIVQKHYVMIYLSMLMIIVGGKSYVTAQSVSCFEIDAVVDTISKEAEDGYILGLFFLAQ